jgi:hypothetical protein
MYLIKEFLSAGMRLYKVRLAIIPCGAISGKLLILPCGLNGRYRRGIIGEGVGRDVP